MSSCVSVLVVAGCLFVFYVANLHCILCVYIESDAHKCSAHGL